jgi:SAM-dependent methyltransferase
MSLESFELFRKIFFTNASMFKKTFLDVHSEFGDSWAAEFNLHLANLFAGDDEAYKDAVRGYTKFAIDAMRLQRLFNKKLRYEDCTYEEACEKVYMNGDYMMKLYLPGILVSHFLWRHHYRQFLYYQKNFLPLLGNAVDRRFYEVGTGTGFYTVQIFRHEKDFSGYGIDISPHSRRFTGNQVKGWGFESSFTPLDLNIIGANLEPLPYIQTVEVLEHLSDPQLFLNHLRRLLRRGGYGFITAALTAPNADHIYLYWTADEVIKQLVFAGFEVLDYFQEEAYVGQEGEIVPKVAAFMVS